MFLHFIERRHLNEMLDAIHVAAYPHLTEKGQREIFDNLHAQLRVLDGLALDPGKLDRAGLNRLKKQVNESGDRSRLKVK